MEEVNGKNSEQLKFHSSKNKKKKKTHGADFGLRIIAVIAAIIVWFVLSITQYPTINKTITNVPVDFSMSGTVAEEKGLSALNYSDITVDVEIKGMNYEIGNYTANDIVANVNVDNVTKEGKYDLEIDVKSTHSTDKCTIVSVSPQTVSVDFDRITTKTLPVEVEAPLVSAEDGFTLRDASVTPSEVTIEGPENELENISKAAAQISKSRKISEDTTISADEIVFYDADDNRLDNENISVKDNKSFDVNFVVYKKKTATIKVDITDVPDTFDVSTLPIQYSEEEISIITPKLDDSSIGKIVVGTIPLSQVNLGKSLTFSVPLAVGEINLNGQQSVTVSFNSTDYITKKFTVSNIVVKNKPTGKKTEIETVSLNNVTLIGPADDINSVSEKELTATIDMSDVTNSGSYAKSAIISVANHNTVWCFGSNEIQVVVSDSDS